jgi:hypothetical protein
MSGAMVRSVIRWWIACACLLVFPSIYASLHVCVCVDLLVHTQIHRHTHKNTQAQAHTGACAYTRMHVRTHTRMHTGPCTHTHTHMNTHKTRTCIHKHACTHKWHTHKHTNISAGHREWGRLWVYFLSTVTTTAEPDRGSSCLTKVTTTTRNNTRCLGSNNCFLDPCRKLKGKGNQSSLTLVDEILLYPEYSFACCINCWCQQEVLAKIDRRRTWPIGVQTARRGDWRCKQ